MACVNTSTTISMSLTPTPSLPTELLELIFTLCSKPTIFASCLVCKFWCQPALDILWKDVPHPVVLLRLLAPWDTEVSGKEKRMSKFSRGLLPADWEAFDRYASRVQSLSWKYDLDKTSIGLAMLSDIARLRPRLILLPSLQVLSVKTEHMDYMTLFLHPGLAELEIDFDSSYTNTRGIQGVHDNLLLLPTMTPRLQSLRINCSYSVSELYSPIATTLPSLPFLKKVSLPRYCLTDKVIGLLGSLPRLETFKHDWGFFGGGGNIDDLREFSVTLQSHSFPALTQMSMELDFPLVKRFLAESAFFERLVSLEIITINRARPKEIQALLELCGRRGRSLTKIDLDGFPNVFDRSTLEDAINMSILEPLLHCSDLAELAIQYPTQVQITEHDLRIIGMKLPKLKRFHLVERPLFILPPLLNMSALPGILGHFPSLEEIGLYIDCNAGYGNPTKLVPVLPKLCSFRFGLSPLDKKNASKVALFLSRFLTIDTARKAEFDISSYGWFTQDYEEMLSDHFIDLRDKWDEAWKEVAEKIPKMVTDRDEAR
ncbi:hypothetical protein M422DRAFT_260371 [Sphaerobolus stellatus SS14]|uniref:F-box domain-containing protein n=1 Tax=Sphaerobolus stellatus (strain SS14) TaxID=990650 RepID=A0A0C9V6J4_SPHS4|nr:hypothetical protein M422DRAFT_260371 [Sphaerobolus stellatus SS14]